MKWKPGQRSDNLKDQRGQSSGSSGLGGSSLGGLGGILGILRMLPIGSKGGMGTIVIVAIVFLLGKGILSGGTDGSGIDIGSILNGTPSVSATGSGTSVDPNAPDPDADLIDFVGFVLDDNQALWSKKLGERYREADLVVFRSQVNSGCGPASSATGPFYCPPDETAYLDLGFFRELTNRYKAPGDFAQAYVIAHEIGHHLQNVLGIEQKVRTASSQDRSLKNDLSIRLELQADCFAGVWARSTYERGILEDGDIEEGLTAASAVGDDRIQESAGARVNPETWTHGSAEQRQTWLRAGFESGDLESCDTFSGDV